MPKLFRSFDINIKFEDAGEIADLYDDISTVRNCVLPNLNRTEAYAEIFKAGIRALLAQINAEPKSESAAIDRVIAEIDRADRIHAKLRRIMRELGPEAAEAAAVADNYDFNLFLESERSAIAKDIPEVDNIRIWLLSILGDGEQHHTDEIRIRAIEDGIINPENADTLTRDWSRLRQIASRSGLTTGNKFYWSGPSNNIN